MKKHTRLLIKFLYAGIMITIIGVILCTIGFLQNGEIAIVSKRIGPFGLIEWRDFHTNDNYKTYTSSDNSIKELNLDISLGDVKVKAGESFKIETRGFDHEEVQTEEKDGVFTFTAKRNKAIIGFNNSCDIIITLPQSVDTLNTDLDFGSVEIDDVNLNTIKLTNLCGDIELNDVIFEDGIFDLDLGNFDFSGQFTRSFDAELNCGSFEANLNGYQNEYDFDLQNNLGNVELDEYSIGGVNTSFNESNNSNRTLTVRVNLGDLSIDFNE